MQRSTTDGQRLRRSDSVRDFVVDGRNSLLNWFYIVELNPITYRRRGWERQGRASALPRQRQRKSTVECVSTFDEADQQECSPCCSSLIRKANVERNNERCFDLSHLRPANRCLFWFISLTLREWRIHRKDVWHSLIISQATAIESPHENEEDKTLL